LSKYTLPGTSATRRDAASAMSVHFTAEHIHSSHNHTPSTEYTPLE
jgi:hypothetical protein